MLLFKTLALRIHLLYLTDACRWTALWSVRNATKRTASFAWLRSDECLGERDETVEAVAALLRRPCCEVSTSTLFYKRVPAAFALKR